MEFGIVKWFNDEKGYGFIEREGKGDIFVYFKNIVMEGHKTLQEGDKVQFDVEQTEKGDIARNVVVVDED